MPQAATLDARLQIYRKVLVEEFIREFKFLMDVMAGRAQERGDFTDKIVDVMKSGVAALVNAALPQVTPGIVKTIITTASQMGLDYLNSERKGNNRYGQIGEIQFEVDFEALRIVLEITALIASRRYEFVIATKLSDIPTEAVIPFAKAGVERMLEYVARNRLPLLPEHLLMGLLYGRSGAYVSGFFNTRLTGKDKKMAYTAEGIYRRSAFMTPEGKYWVSAKAPTWNFDPLLQDFQDLVPDKVKGFFRKKGQAATTPPKPLLVKFDKNNKTDPKYGYASMPQKNVDIVFGQTKQEQSVTKISASLRQALNSHSAIYQVVNRSHIEAYLKGDKKSSFIQYLKTKYPGINKASYEPANEEDYDLTALNCKGANFSDCILNNVKIAGDISDGKFENAHLIGADFTRVKQAKGTSFAGAHCEFMKADGANLAYADFTGAQCQFAEFNGANLSFIKNIGTQWIGAKLAKLQTEDKNAEDKIFVEQKKQDVELKEQQKKMQALEKQVKQQQESVADLQELVKRLEAQLENADDNKEKSEQAQKMQAMLAELMQERQTREAFTRYCQSQLKSLRQHADSTDEKLNLHEEQIKQLQQQLRSSNASEAPIKALAAELKAAINQLDKVEAKQQQTDNTIKQLELRVNDYVKSQQQAMEAVYEGLANVQEEVERFKQEVRGDINRIDNDINDIRDELRKLKENKSGVQLIPRDERQNIFAQQFMSLMSQLTGLQSPQAVVKPLIDPHHVIASTQLSFQNKLADGSFGKVYLGRWCEQFVAIKQLEGTLNPLEEIEFIREVNIMSRLKNPNIVQFYGACLESSRACLIMEYMEQGALAHVLNKGPLTPQQQKQIALEIAKGLVYLHSQKVFHRDIKSGNVLISSEGHAKISDFGLSKVNYSSVQSILKQADAIQWQSPESLRGDEYTDKSDIYSYGIVLWEIFTCGKPFKDLEGPALFKAILSNDKFPGVIPENVPDKIAHLIKACWQKEPQKRPGLTHILREIESYQPRPPSPSAEEYYNRGINAEKNKDLVGARNNYQRAAVKNYPRAKTNLGTFFLKGLGGCPLDKAKAFEFYIEAAQAGHVRAMFNVACMLEMGDGIAPNLPEALKWYEQAAAKGDEQAQQKVRKIKEQLQNKGDEDYKKKISMRPN